MIEGRGARGEGLGASSRAGASPFSPAGAGKDIFGLVTYFVSQVGGAVARRARGLHAVSERVLTPFRSDAVSY